MTQLEWASGIDLLLDLRLFLSFCNIELKISTQSWVTLYLVLCTCTKQQNIGSSERTHALHHYFCEGCVSVCQKGAAVVVCGPSSFFYGRARQIEGRGPHNNHGRHSCRAPSQTSFPPLLPSTYNFYRGGETRCIYCRVIQY